MKALWMVVVVVLGACVSTEPGGDTGPSDADAPPIIMTLPASTFVQSGAGELAASVVLTDGTPIIGATIEARCSAPSTAVACVTVGDAQQCSDRAACGEASRPFQIPMYEVAIAGAPLALTLTTDGDAAVTGALIAMRSLPDPL